MYILLVLTIALLSAINITTGITIVSPFQCLVVCFPSECKNITCPEGQKLGRKYACDCCKECVIPEGGQCWDFQQDSSTPSFSSSTTNIADIPSCEFGLICCRGICSRSCFETTTDFTTESTLTESTTTESAISTTETPITEPTTEPTESVTA